MKRYIRSFNLITGLTKHTYIPCHSLSTLLAKWGYSWQKSKTFLRHSVTFGEEQEKKSNKDHKEADLANKHLKYENAETPPVHGPRVRCLRQHLGGQELWRPAECWCPVSVTHSLLAQAEVGDLNEAVGVQQQIV